MALDNLNEQIAKADAGDAQAMLSVASDIVWGDLTVELEPELAAKALGYYNHLAQDGVCDALLDLGAMYLEGRGVEKNEARALAFYQAAADQLYPKAFRCLGNFWLFSSSQAPDYRRAFDAFHQGAQLEEQNALYMLGDMYRDGIQVEKDARMAFQLYQRAEKAVARNDFGYAGNDVSWDDCYSDVQLRLGECYLDGRGTTVDLDRAITCLQESVRVYRRRIQDGDDYGRLNIEQLERAQGKLAEALKRQDEITG
jgi:TPR repeat protein